MTVKYCQLCKRPVEAKRRISVGTLLAVLFTGFTWLLALPFYRKRCPICRGIALSDTSPSHHCLKCGNGTDPAARFCPTCGTERGASPQPPQEASTREGEGRGVGGWIGYGAGTLVRK